eukprot:Em0002g323a
MPTHKMNIHRRAAFLLLVIMTHLCCSSNSAPVTLLCRLFNQHSGLFVQVTQNGTITADETEESAAVFSERIQGNLVSFELNDEPRGRFLMLNEITECNDTNTTGGIPSKSTYELAIGIPSTNPCIISHIQWELVSADARALRQMFDQGDTCYVAFNDDGP